MAHELGLFAARGLRVELSREVGWATIRDKVVLRELEAAHAPAPMVLTISLGVGSFKVSCLTGLVLNLQGNAITLSTRLWEAGVRDDSSLAQFVRSRPKMAPLAFGIAFSCSSHNFLLQQWLRAAGLEPSRDVNIVVVPPAQMAANLRAGHLDGYCVGEPWNSLAIVQRAGWVVALSSRIAPRHPEKVLLVRSDFASARAYEHEQLIAALHEACDYCQRHDNRERVAQILAQPSYLNTNVEAVRRSLLGAVGVRANQFTAMEDLHIFAGPDVNEPGLDKAMWARASLRQTGVLPRSIGVDQSDLAAAFRSDIFHSATQATLTPSPTRAC
jgi:ABC-type nitrate/sulfonate/bicarbonate transport system substrate-binding protein